MEPLYLNEIIKVTQGSLVKSTEDTVINSISIDSRTIKPSDLFIAIKGDNFDGHSFVADALKKGACGAIVERKKIRNFNLTNEYVKKKILIEVKDTLKALGYISSHYRDRFDIPFIAVTGTCGKTTTKDMLFHLLSARLKVLRNEGTKNNHIGLPLTLFQLNKSFDVAVLELGMNHFGEIDYLSKILKPNVGIITNVGKAHFEFVKNINGVLRAKEELLRNLPNSAIAILNADDQRLMRIGDRYSFKKITFGIKNRCDFRASQIEMDKGIIRFRLNGRDTFKLRMLGISNVYNALAAIVCSSILGMDVKVLKEAFESFKGSDMRMKMVSFKDMLIIDDTYNANPLSAKNAIDTISGLNGGRRIMVFSDMLELGKYSRRLHRKIGNYIACKKIDILVTVGALSKDIAFGAIEAGMKDKNVHSFETKKEALEMLNKETKPNDIILFKGSRLTKMEELLSCFTTSCTP